MSWNFADVWERIAETAPDTTALLHGGERVAWRDFDRRADGVAAALLRAGLRAQDKVALYLYNGPAYLESTFGCLKAGMVPVNTNYRYLDDELHYLFDNADAAAVVFHGEFTPRVDALRARCPKVRAWLHVDDGSTPCPDWAIAYEPVAAQWPGRVRAPWGRSGDHLLLIYTGGTTGRPRGVMWRQTDLYVASNTAGDPPEADLEGVTQRVRSALASGEPQPVGLPAAPLMHGTAFVFAASILTRGGAVTTLAARRFDVEELLDTIGRDAVTDLCIVGDAFCRPMVDALEAAPQRWDLRSLKAVSSSGMMWSDACKQGLLRHAPEALLVDFLNSSEASGMGRSVSSRTRPQKGASFRLGKHAFVIDEQDRPVAPGSGIAGRVAVRGLVPLGYYGDAEKTARTFPVIDGVRCAVPGDYARVEADGTITLLGRGSVSINTGGEKVFPEEVEECIKTLAGVNDAVVVGVPDARFGETVAAAVELAPGAALAPEAITAHVRALLAAHKVPRRVMLVDSVGRGPNGKADYPQVRRRVQEWLAATQRS
jgi:3-oxocholest-4-en-26-oate---CoA ligase